MFQAAVNFLHVELDKDERCTKAYEYQYSFVVADI
jgi:hypothetical protein